MVSVGASFFCTEEATGWNLSAFVGSEDLIAETLFILHNLLQ